MRIVEHHIVMSLGKISVPEHQIVTGSQSIATADFFLLKFIYSEKATKFCEISILLLTTVHTVKIKVEISQNFAAFSEYMNFTYTVQCTDFKMPAEN